LILRSGCARTTRCGSFEVNATPTDLSGEFDALYSPFGRESIPPERLIRGLLLQAFYSIRSEHQLVERIEFDLLFRWFVGLGEDDPAWNATTFTKNRDRLLAADVAMKFLGGVLAQPKVRALLSTEHFFPSPRVPQVTPNGSRRYN
jgi:hypothetical protein